MGLEDAEWPDLDPSYYVDEDPDEDDEDTEPDDGAVREPPYVARLLCHNLGGTFPIDFSSVDDALRAMRDPAGCGDHCHGLGHTLVAWQDGQVRAVAAVNFKLASSEPNTALLADTPLTDDELEAIAAEEREAVHKAARRQRRKGPYTVGAVALTANGTLTSAATTEPPIDLDNLRLPTLTALGTAWARRFEVLAGIGTPRATATAIVSGALTGSGGLSCTAHPPRRKRGAGSICWSRRNGWIVTVYRTVDGRSKRWWRYSQSHDAALDLLADMLAQVRAERGPAPASLTGRGALKGHAHRVTPQPRRRGRGQGSIYFRAGYRGRSGQWCAALGRRVVYARSESEAEAKLAKLRGDLQVGTEDGGGALTAKAAPISLAARQPAVAVKHQHGS